MTGHFGDTMGDVVDCIDPRHALLLKEVYRLTLLLGENRYQHIGTGHFAFAR